MRLRRRGNVYDAFTIMLSLFAIGFVSVLVLLLVNVFKNDIVADTSLPIEARNIAESGESQLPGIFDWFFAVMFIGLPLLSAVLAYFNNIHPLFFWLSLIVVILVVIVGAAYMALWGALATDATLNEQMERLPITNLVLTNYGMYSLLIFIIIAFGTFVKLRRGANYSGGMPP